jgi:hypothetical protein
MLARERAGEFHATLAVALILAAGRMVRDARRITAMRRRGRHRRADLRHAVARPVLFSGARLSTIASTERAGSDLLVSAPEPARSEKPTIK